MSKESLEFDIARIFTIEERGLACQTNSYTSHPTK